ncbi:CPBP family intramembrane metalloprotease [Staphylococcus condimenti]|uniref:CPBP family intramembrane metalloprotease n=1 Tax=Staphylococcus condimenti TaxID=70255 RepID=A0A4Q7CMV2_9STAP|nr:CPBP family intramembrane glutamic endopeptidase [Staphylococcus condimenti]RZI01169.1 CPBP family intramembrane metalloprotease [Staphylococcus condimenti]RZI03535.1 CPBP family intramembrane metalloprotease [Staphylococcus condimenti]
MSERTNHPLHDSNTLDSEYTSQPPRRRYQLIRRPRQAQPGASRNLSPKGNIVVNILIFLGFMIATQIPTAIAGSVAGYVSFFNGDSPIVFSILILLYIVASGLMAWLITWYYRKRGYERMKAIHLKDVGIDVLFFIGIRVWTTLCMIAATGIFKEDSTANDRTLMRQINKLTDFSDPMVVIALAIFLIHISFIAPYFEELTFRGIFKETIFRKLSFWWPMLISSAIFSLNHMPNNIIIFFLYGGMGAGFYMAYNRKRNIWDSYIVHMLNNASASIAIIFLLMFV